MGSCRKELAEAVIEDCYKESLTVCLARHGVLVQNFFGTLSQVPSLEEAYARAQQARSEIFMDQIIEIADNEDIDYNRARNMIQVRQLYASKMKPGKFGDRIDVNINQHVDIRGALDEAKNRIRNVLDISKTQTVETTLAIPSSETGLKPVDDNEPALISLDDLLK